MRNRMISENLAKSTIDGYLYAVNRLALFCQKSFEDIEIDDVYAFLVDLRQVHKLSRDTIRIAVCGIKYLYKYFLHRDDIIKDIPYPKKEKYLPQILTSKQLRLLFERTENLKHRVFLKLTYSAGLRRSEVCKLRITDVDSKNMQIRVRQGKGKKDRYVSLSHHVLCEARNYIRQYNPVDYLFNGRSKAQAISHETSAWIMEQAVKRAGITQKVSLHTLRHCFASHLLSCGVNLLTIQQLLGHQDIRTTMVYLHIRRLCQNSFTNPLDLIYPSPSKKHTS